MVRMNWKWSDKKRRFRFVLKKDEKKQAVVHKKVTLGKNKLWRCTLLKIYTKIFENTKKEYLIMRCKMRYLAFETAKRRQKETCWKRKWTIPLLTSPFASLSIVDSPCKLTLLRNSYNCFVVFHFCLLSLLFLAHRWNKTFDVFIELENEFLKHPTSTLAKLILLQSNKVETETFL